MRGTVVSECVKYSFDERYNKFNINLPHPGKKENVVSVLVPANYPYQPKKDEVVELSGSITTYDEKQAGLQTYIIIISLYKSVMEDFDIKNNTVFVTGKVFKKDSLAVTSSGVSVQRLSISTNTEGRYIPVHCIGYNAAALALEKLNLNNMAEVSGRLISRKFLYREDIYRTTTELFVDYVYPIII